MFLFVISFYSHFLSPSYENDTIFRPETELQRFASAITIALYFGSQSRIRIRFEVCVWL